MPDLGNDNTGWVAIDARRLPCQAEMHEGGREVHGEELEVCGVMSTVTRFKELEASQHIHKPR
eukprot:4568748-Amphidinium_carterae.1